LTGYELLWHIDHSFAHEVVSESTLPTGKEHIVTDDKQPQDPEQIPVEQEAEEVIDVTFFDRVLAFVALIYPFSLLIDKTQELLQDKVGSSVNNILVLVGLIAFLLIVNRVAKLIYALRNRK
jgi:hypothetical protein